VSLKSDTNKVYFTEDKYTFFKIISRSFHLRMSNVSDEIAEKIKTHILCSATIFFSKIMRL